MALDNFRRIDMKINRANDYQIETQFAKEGDYNGRELVVQITDAGEVKNQSGVSLNLGWRHDSVGNTGLDPFTVVDITKGIFKIAYPKEMLNAGLVTAVIQVVERGKITLTRNFKITVENNPIDEGAIVSENSFTALTEALVKVNDFETQLAQKPTKEEVDDALLKKRDKAVPINQNDVSDGFLAQFVENTQPINAVPAKGSLETIRVKPKGLNENATSFIQHGKNFLDKDSFLHDYQVNTVNGELDSWAGRSTSDFIKIEQNTDYVYNFNMRAYVFYDSSYNFISGGLANFTNKTFTPPLNAYFMRVSMDTAWVVNAQFELGTTQTEYENYELKLDKSNYEQNINLNKESLDGLVTGLANSLNLGRLKKSAGEFTSHRGYNSVFDGWAYEFKKSDFANSITRIEAYINIGDNDNKAIDLVILNDDRSYELYKQRETFSGQGKITFNVNIPLDLLTDNFYVGYKTDGTHGVMPSNATENPSYTTNGTYYLTEAWSLASGTSYNATDLKVYEGFETELKPHKHIASDIEGLSVGENKVKLSLPDKYELVVGDTFELFYKGIVYAAEPFNYNIKVESSKGKAYRRKYEYKPVASDVGTHGLTISIYNDDDVLLDTKTLDLVVSEKASNPSTAKNVLSVGDSLTANGEWVTELHNRLVTQDSLNNINFIGTRSDLGIPYEGYGGWSFIEYNTQGRGTGSVWINLSSTMKTAEDQHSIYEDINGTQWKIETIGSTNSQLKILRGTGSTDLPSSGTLTWVSGGVDTSDIVYTLDRVDSQNPFWNSTTNEVDFANYANNLGVSTIDYIYVLVGWNNSTTSESEYKNRTRTFIDNVLSDFPNAKITLMGIQVPDIDGLGANYGASWNYKETLKFVFDLNQWYMEVANEYTNVDFINIAGQFDTEYNMPRSERDVNVRNSAHKEWRGYNGVHPALEGYYQIADTVYRNIHHKI